MIKIYELENITLGEAYHLNQFYNYDITVKNGQVILIKKWIIN